MNILSWNIRGLANNPLLRRLKKIVKSNKINFISIQKPKINHAYIKDIMFKLNCGYYMTNQEGNILLLWKPDFKCSVLQVSTQYITIQLQILNMDVIISVVHASCDCNGR